MGNDKPFVIRCDICHRKGEELAIVYMDGTVWTMHPMCYETERQRRIQMKANLQKAGIKTWNCSCGAMNRLEMDKCMICGKAKPAGNGKVLAGAALKASQAKAKAVAKNGGKPIVKAKAKVERVIPKVTKAGAKVLGVAKCADGHDGLKIACVECGKPRIIHFADAFQVKRCQACQEAYKKGNLDKMKAKKKK